MDKTIDRSKCKKWKAVVAWCGGILLLFVIWYIVAFCLKSQGNKVLEYPHESIKRAFCLLFINNPGNTWMAIGNTILRLLIGVAISFILGMVLGTLAGLYEWFKYFMKPMVTVFKTIPTAAVVILLIGVMLGIGDHDAINFIPTVLVVLVAFPLIFQAFLTGVTNEDPAILNALDIENGRKNIRSVLFVIIPDARSYVSLSLAQSLGLSMKVSVMAEILSSSSNLRPGIGSLIAVARQQGEIENIVAYSLIVLLIMGLADLPLLILKLHNKLTFIN